MLMQKQLVQAIFYQLSVSDQVVAIPVQISRETLVKLRESVLTSVAKVIPQANMFGGRELRNLTQ